jgi:DNA modification methylase
MTDSTIDGVPVFCAFDDLAPIESITPNPRNPNTHPDTQVALLAKIISAQGWRAPITVSNRSGFVTKGHGRLLAARHMGQTSVPIDRQDYADEASEYADMIADNRIAELAEIDATLLKDLILDIDTGDIDIELTGFTEAELARMMSAVGQGDIVEDEAPEPPADPVTKPGDLWLLGEHRVLCGDSTKPEDVARLMGDAKADMMFTDPPWNVAIGGDANPRHRQRKGLDNDNLPPAEFAAFLDGFMAAVKAYIVGDVYCVLGASEWPTLDLALRNNVFHWSATIIWAKDQFVLGRAKYHRRYEPIWYGWSGKGKLSFCDRRDLDDVWEIPRPKRSVEHPTMKPVALCAKAIANSSIQSVIDPFGGSGTTLIAADQLGRTCYTIELDPAYTDVIVQRWENLTGRKAVLDNGTGTGEEQPR